MINAVAVVDAAPDEALNKGDQKFHTIAVVQSSTAEEINNFLKTRASFLLRQYKNIGTKGQKEYLLALIQWLERELSTSKVCLIISSAKESIIEEKESLFLEMLGASEATVVRNYGHGNVAFIGGGYCKYQDPLRSNQKYVKVVSEVHNDTTGETKGPFVSRELRWEHAIMILWKAFELRRIYNNMIQQFSVDDVEVNFEVLLDNLPSNKGFDLLDTFVNMGRKGWVRLYYSEDKKNIDELHFVDNIAALFNYYSAEINPDPLIIQSIERLLTAQPTKDHFDFRKNTFE